MGYPSPDGGNLTIWLRRVDDVLQYITTVQKPGAIRVFSSKSSAALSTSIMISAQEKRRLLSQVSAHQMKRNLIQKPFQAKTSQWLVWWELTGSVLMFTEFRTWTPSCYELNQFRTSASYLGLCTYRYVCIQTCRLRHLSSTSSQVIGKWSFGLHRLQTLLKSLVPMHHLQNWAWWVATCVSNWVLDFNNNWFCGQSRTRLRESP